MNAWRADRGPLVRSLVVLGVLLAACTGRGEPEHPRMIPVVGAAHLAAELGSRTGPVVVEFHTVW